MNNTRKAPIQMGMSVPTFLNIERSIPIVNTYFAYVDQVRGGFFQLTVRMDSYEGDNMEVIKAPELQPGEKKIVLVTHDESCFESNDAKRTIWIEDDNQALRPKGSGKSLMVSKFLCQCHGHMEVKMTEELVSLYPDLKFIARKVAETIRFVKSEKNADGYWGNSDLVAQFKVTIVLFDILHPDCTPMFAFDNSANHHAFAPHAFRASRLNLSDGGKNNPLLRNGWLRRDGHVIAHNLQFINSSNHTTIQKGLRRILQERRLWPSNQGLNLSESRLLLSQQEDFKSQCEWLEETASDRGRMIIFCLKFHPEFN